jgi:ketosteroid isomerase-like protein
MTTFARLKSVLLAAVGLSLAAPGLVTAQEWSPAQQAVWKNVEAYWTADTSGDVDGFLAYFDAQYIGWHVGDALPSNKARASKFIRHQSQRTKTLLHDIQPVAITIHGEIAVVHYYWTVITKTGEEKETREAGRWTDVLKRSGDKWLLIADHGGSVRD